VVKEKDVTRGKKMSEGKMKEEIISPEQAMDSEHGLGKILNLFSLPVEEKRLYEDIIKDINIKLKAEFGGIFKVEKVGYCISGRAENYYGKRNDKEMCMERLLNYMKAEYRERGWDVESTNNDSLIFKIRKTKKSA
jgi:hypothetical protein